MNVLSHLPSERLHHPRIGKETMEQNYWYETFKQVIPDHIKVIRKVVFHSSIIHNHCHVTQISKQSFASNWVKIKCLQIFNGKRAPLSSETFSPLFEFYHQWSINNILAMNPCPWSKQEKSVPLAATLLQTTHNCLSDIWCSPRVLHPT